MNNEIKHDFVIDPSDKFYPQANEWMWTYCIFLGKYTDSKGRNYDLGVHVDETGECDATVHSNNPGDYTSGEFSFIATETREFKLEAKYFRLVK